jgi:hypothetical protein
VLWISDVSADACAEFTVTALKCGIGKRGSEVPAGMKSLR